MSNDPQHQDQNRLFYEETKRTKETKATMGHFRLRRTSIFDPPTPLDEFLLSPLCAIVQRLYRLLLALRGAPFEPPKSRPPIRIVCISDTHTHTPHVPDGDLLIHAGDMTNDGTVRDIQVQLDWLDSLPHQHKIVIAGNHDSYFDPRSRLSEDKASGAELNYRSIHYLENQSLQLEFRDGRVLNFYGSPDIPQCGGADFALVGPYYGVMCLWRILLLTIL